MVATPSRLPVKASMNVEQVSGNPVSGNLATLAASAAVYGRTGRRMNPSDDRRMLAQRWQIEAYRHLHICGEARYAVTLFANMAARAELGISEGSSLGRKAVWIDSGIEVDALAELVPTVRERKRLIRNYMTHYVIAGECYLIARKRRDTDPDPTNPDSIWEIVGVTEIRRQGSDEMGNALWQVRHDNDVYIDLAPGDPVLRLWNPDPEQRREPWSPMRSALPTLREIEYLTSHIFTQVRSRLMSAGVWFLPENLTFSPPPVDAVEGGAEAIAEMNEAEMFMASLAASSMSMMEADEVSFPTVVMADPLALQAIDQQKLIKFWSEIDDKAMTLRGDAVRRFALGWDLPPEQVLGASGLAVTGSGGSAGSVNHWGVWANEEQTISNHIEPALDNLVDSITTSIIRVMAPGTSRVAAYDTASLRLRQDRSKEAAEWYDRGALSLDVALRENGFDPEHDKMTDDEFKRFVLLKMLGGSPTPEMMVEAMKLLGQVFNPPAQGETGGGTGVPGPALPPSLDDHPYEGPPREQHDHSPAPFTTLHASAEALVLRALEKAGNRLLNDGKRGRERDRHVPAHLAHLEASAASSFTPADFDFSFLPTVLSDIPAARQARIGGALTRYCVNLYKMGDAYSRDGLIVALRGL